jgi:hypothetical protein
MADHEYDDDWEMNNLEDVEDDDLDDMEGLIDAFEEDDEDDEDDDESAAERRRRHRYFIPRRRPRTASGRGYFRKRLSKRYATQQQLRAGLAKLSKRLRRNGMAIKINIKRIRSLSRGISDQGRTDSRQTRAIKSVRRKVDATIQMLQLLSLFAGGEKTYEIIGFNPEATITLGENEPVVIPGDMSMTVTLEEEGDTIDRFLPLLLLGGLADTKEGDLMSNPLMMIPLLGALG